MKKSGFFILTIMLTLVGVLGDSSQTQAIDYGVVSRRLTWKPTERDILRTRELEVYKAWNTDLLFENAELRQQIHQLEELETIKKVLEIVEEKKRLQHEVWKLQEENENLQRQNRNLHTGGGCAGDC